MSKFEQLMAIPGLTQLMAAGKVQCDLPHTPAIANWTVTALAGTLVELNDHARSANLTFAALLTLDAQHEHEPAAWLNARKDHVYPPDLGTIGVDLNALLFVHLDNLTALAQAAEELLRSGAFGLLVLDLGPPPTPPLAVQQRLSALCRKHQSVLLCLTQRQAQGPMSTLVTVYGCSQHERVDGEFLCTLTITKDRRQGAGWQQQKLCYGPDGLR